MTKFVGLPLLLLVGAAGAQIIFPDQLDDVQRDNQAKKYELPPFDDFQVPPQVPAKQPIRGTNPDSPVMLRKWMKHMMDAISRGVTRFTLNLDRVIEKSTMFNKRENIVFSPMSLTFTLAMVLLGSGGKTFEELAYILGLDSKVDIFDHSEIVHQIIGYHMQKSEPQCKFAFGLFVQDGFPLRDEFLAFNKKVYKSEVLNVDFKRRAKQAQVIINDWVNTKTNGKIKSMLNEPPNPSSDLIITSALYFNADWAQPFEEFATKRKPFSIEPNDTIDVNMMFNGAKFPFYEDKNLDLKIIGLPYKGNQVTMYAIMPTVSGTSALKKLKNHLTPEILDGLIQKMEIDTCIVGLPRMKLSSTLMLQSTLEALGLHSLFDPWTADLSLLSPGRGHQSASYRRGPRSDAARTSPVDRELRDFLNSRSLTSHGIDELRNGARLANPGLYADDVLHKVEMSVNERGTEAAAATSVVLDRSGNFKKFVANRPFLLFVRHEPSKVIWFWATIVRPTPFYPAGH